MNGISLRSRARHAPPTRRILISVLIAVAMMGSACSSAQKQLRDRRFDATPVLPPARMDLEASEFQIEHWDYEGYFNDAREQYTEDRDELGKALQEYLTNEESSGVLPARYRLRVVKEESRALLYGLGYVFAVLIIPPYLGVPIYKQYAQVNLDLQVGEKLYSAEGEAEIFVGLYMGNASSRNLEPAVGAAVADAMKKIYEQAGPKSAGEEVKP